MRTAIDPIDDALEDLRIAGSVVLHETYEPPWAISVPGEEELRRLLGVGFGKRIVPFHLVRRGGFDLAIDGAAPIRLAEQELSICPGGRAHVLSQGRGARPTPLASILSLGDTAGPLSRAAGATELVCGVFYLRAAPLNPLLSALPPNFKISLAEAGARITLAATADMLASLLQRRAHGDFTAARLLEVLCAEAFRALLEQADVGTAGWLKGLSDPKISQVIRAIHTDPGAQHGVESLAAAVSLSPSRFAARFRETVGLSVMSYVARWRLGVASRLLRETDLSLARIAEQVGYESVPAFSRAFKAELDESPAAWRKAAQGRGLAQPAA